MSCIPEHPYNNLANASLNLINQQQDIYKTSKIHKLLKYKLLISKREKVDIKYLKNPTKFIIYSQSIDDVCENLEDYNPTKTRKVLIV